MSAIENRNRTGMEICGEKEIDTGTGVQMGKGTTMEKEMRTGKGTGTRRRMEMGTEIGTREGEN